MITDNDVNVFVKWCEANLNLCQAQLPEEYYYGHLSLCVMDCIYAINTKYKQPVKMVDNYCKHFNLKRIRTNKTMVPSIEVQQKTSDLVSSMLSLGTAYYTDEIFCWYQSVKTGNNARTPKTDLVLTFANLLCSNGIEYFQDVQPIIHNKVFEDKALAIKGIGQRTLNYFFMLAGDDNTIKFDRWLERNANSVLNRKLSMADGQNLYIKSCAVLKRTYHNITPRLLDYKVWEFMRRIA
jgi:hypothetical protein